jgi:hypothetical protein
MKERKNIEIMEWSDILDALNGTSTEDDEL